METFYGILGVHSGADQEEIILAYAAKQNEPGIDLESVRMAFRTLSSPSLRASYDRWLANRQSAPTSGSQPAQNLSQIQPSPSRHTKSKPGHWSETVGIYWMAGGWLHALYMKSWGWFVFHTIASVAVGLIGDALLEGLAR